MNSVYTVQAVFEAVDNLTSTVSKVENSLKNAGATMQRVGGMMSAGLTAPMALLGKQAVDTALDADRLTRTLEGLAGGADAAATYIEAIKEASQGTIPQVDALAIANRALSFGVVQNADDMARLTEIAITLGRAQGLDAATAVSDLTTALSRQSPMILDNLGITMKLTEAYAVYADKLGKTVEQLTAEEKAEAFRMAALEKGMEVVEQMGGLQDDAAGSVERFNAQLADAKLLIGNALLPILSPLLEKLTGLVTWFTNLDESTREWIVKIGLVVAAAGPLLVILGTVVSTVGTLAGVLSPLGPVVLAIGAALVLLKEPLKSLASAFEPLGNAIMMALGGDTSALMEGFDFTLRRLFGDEAANMIMDFIQAFEPLANAIKMALGGNTSALMEGFDFTLRRLFGDDFADTIGESISSVQDHLSKLQPIFQDVVNFGRQAVDWFTANWPRIQATIQKVLNVIQNIIVAVIGRVVPFMADMFGKIVDWVVDNWPLIQQTIQTVMTFVSNIIQTVLAAIGTFWDAHGAQILNAVSLAWDSLKMLIGTALDVILGIIRTVMQVINGDWEGAWETVCSIGETVWATIQAMFTNFINAILGFFNTNVTQLVETWRTNLELAQLIVTTVWSFIVTFIQEQLQAIVDAVTTRFEAIRQVADTIWTAIKDTIIVIVGVLLAMLTGQWDIAFKILAEIWDRIKATGLRIWTALKDTIISIIGALEVWLQSTWNNIQIAAQTAWDLIKTSITDTVQRLAEWLETTWDLIKTAAETAWQKLKEAVSGKVQSLYDSVTGKIKEIKTFVENFNLFDAGVKLIESLISGVGSMFEKLMNVISDLIGGAIDAALDKLFGEGGGDDGGAGSMRNYGRTMWVEGAFANPGDRASAVTYDNSRHVISQSTVNVNGMGLGSILALAAEQV